MEEDGDEREGRGADEGADEDIGHPLADRGFGFVGEMAEDREQNQGG